MTGKELSEIISSQINKALTEISSKNSDELHQVLLCIFNKDWCEKNAAQYDKLSHEEYHPFMDHAISAGGKGLVLGLIRIFELFSNYFIDRLKDTELHERLQNQNSFKAVLFELSVLGCLADNGFEIKEFDHKTKKGDVEALIKVDGVEVLVECKLLNESDIEIQIDELMQFGLPEPANGVVRFITPPVEEDFAKIKTLFKETISNQSNLEFSNERITVNTYALSKSETSYSIEYDGVSRHKNTLRKALKKVDKGRKMWFFCGVFPDSRQGDAIDGFTELLQEKRYNKNIHEISIVLLRDSMEYIHMGYHNLKNPCNAELKEIK